MTNLEKIKNAQNLKELEKAFEHAKAYRRALRREGKCLDAYYFRQELAYKSKKKELKNA